MRDVILVDTFKGGVGKTTTAVALSHALAERAPTVLVGTSPQNDVLDTLSSMPSIRKGLREYLVHGASPDLIAIEPRLALLPAGYANPQQDPQHLAERLRHLWDAIEARFIVVDGFNFTDPTAFAALSAADILITPTTIYPESTRAVLRVFRFIQERVPPHQRPRIVRALLTQVPSRSRRNKAEEALYSTVREVWRPRLCETEIRRSARYNITELPSVDGSPVVRGSLMMGTGFIGTDYADLGREIVELIATTPRPDVSGAGRGTEVS